MGFLGDIADRFFGGEEKKAGKQAAKELKKGREALSEAIEEGRVSAVDLFGASQETLADAIREALGIITPATAETARLFQGGNVAAQQQIANSAEQIRRAIMGQPVDYSVLSPVALEPDFSFMEQAAPATRPIQQTLNPAPAQVDISGIDFANLLRGSIP